MLTRRAALALAPAGLAFGLAPRLARAASPETFNTASIAINGTDPVAYFTNSAFGEGDYAYGLEEHARQWKGATWLFASAENLAAFEAAPEAYAPQYGGYCAYAMAEGAVATTVPSAWTIHEGKLYLNFSDAVRDYWRKDIPGNVAAADSHWPEALNA